MTQSNTQETPISFKGYQIKKLEYGTDIEKEKDRIGIKYGISNDQKMGQVVITVYFSDKSKSSNGILEVIGQFEIKKGLTEKQQHIFLGQNGSAILYPYVRAILSMVTALDDNRVQVLPTLNFVNLAKNDKIKKQ
ncbi:protein-export chaperone SecB [Limosilactobacillus sp. RRLNB_1_1]|uniref:Protein-export chaperone SecB n=1 Tax=Limosilactobacillus albertensis TaxID=2759752 RepID=A0A7W3TR82_9LACO|nr:protein-export chaperone SecB [Limosilactobacillus albertensis]MBB1069364.1 protein-export chaperone SecB [Limosilactobacillus albertensis]MCD7118604.1 protein-export chaperone SecB [Limosilactobacillus albertensis]MCD7128351.1 protein-export chaperone SecB [Limosilactobacillus albertensis]